ncbi:hypothetical protein ONZ45_g6147 [Pleurotus djamor]|nr:hypothetical protein ONZ45_g6147 [Pleurotus djamor]
MSNSFIPTASLSASHPNLNPRSSELTLAATASFAGLNGLEVDGGRLPDDVGPQATPSTPKRVLEDDVNWSDWLQDSPVKGAGRDGDTSLQDARLDYPSASPPQATSEASQEDDEVELGDSPAGSPFQDTRTIEDHPNSSVVATSAPGYDRTLIPDAVQSSGNSTELELHPYARAHTVTLVDPPAPPTILATPPPHFDYFSDEMVAARYIGSISDGLNVPSNYVLPGIDVLPPPGFVSWEAYHGHLGRFFTQHRLICLRTAFEDGCWNDFLNEITKHFPGEGGARILRRAMQMAQVFGLPPECFVLDAAEAFLGHFAPGLMIRSNTADDFAFGRMIQAIWCIIHPNHHLLFGPAHVWFFKPLIEDLGANWPTRTLIQTANIADLPYGKL